MDGLLDRYRGLFSRSIFSFFNDETIDRILADSKVRHFQKGEGISFSNEMGWLCLVLEGQVSMRSLDKKSIEKDRIIPGRTIELGTLLSKDKKWKHRWIAHSQVDLLLIPWTTIKHFLDQEPGLTRYLEKVTRSVALQKLQKDFRAFQISSQKFREIVLALKRRSIEEIFENSSENTFLAITKGELDVFVDVSGQRTLIKTYNAGDYCSLDLGDPGLIIERHPGTVAWFIGKSNWSNLNCKDEFERLLKMIGDSSLETSFAEMDESDQLDSGQITDPLSDMPAPPKKLPRTILGFWNLIKLKLFGHFPVEFHLDESRSMESAFISFVRFLGYKAGIDSVISLSSSINASSEAQKLEQLCRATGFSFIPFSIDWVSLKKSLPAIIIYRGEPVVLCKLNKKYGLLSLPSEGISKHVPISDLISESSDEAYVIQAGPKSRNINDVRVSFLSIFTVVFKSPYFLVLMVLGGIFAAIFEMAIPVVNKYVFDSVIDSRDHGLVLIVVGIIFILGVFGVVLRYIESGLSARLQSFFEGLFSSIYLNKLARMPVQLVKSVGYSDLVARFEELTFLGLFTSVGAIRAFSYSFSLVLSSFLLYIYSPKFLMVILILIPIQFLINFFMSSRLGRLANQETLLSGIDYNLVLEQIDSYEQISSINGQLVSRWRWEENYVKLLRVRNNFNKMSGALDTLQRAYEELSILVILVFGAYSYYQGELTIGQVIAATALAGWVFIPLKELVRFLFFVPKFTTVSRRLSPVYLDKQRTQSKQKMNVAGELSVEKASYRYGDEGMGLILKGVNLHLKPGETALIVGANSSGKTTLAKMLTGIHLPQAGDIKLDGVSYSALPKNVLQDNVSIVDHEGYLFHGSLLENIALGDDLPDMEKAVRAAKLSCSDEFISKMKEGFSEEILSGGVGLSEGQKQRLLLARALYREPKILIMDEATNALDNITEEQIYNSLFKLRDEMSLVVISPRVNLATRFDRVLFLKDGRILEDGTHAELLSKEQHYYKYFCQEVSVW